MATNKWEFQGAAKGAAKLKYALEKQMPGDPLSANGCRLEEGFHAINEDFEDVRTLHNHKGPNAMVELTHSFSPEESKTITPELVNQIGHEVAKEFFPGHQFVVITHLDRDHYHNHIFVNSVHMETGKRVHNKFEKMKKIRDVNDRVCKSYGLSVPNEQRKAREAKMPEKVALMVRHGRRPFKADLMQKADFARAYSTNYAEYQGILSEFGIAARLEKRNITYFYPGRDIGVRGRSMGALYDKAGLEKSFRGNDAQFQSKPSLRAEVAKGIGRVKSEPIAIMQVASDLGNATAGHFRSGVKDYSKHAIVPRRQARWARASEEDLAECLVPIGEIRKARSHSIVEYCKRNRIDVVKNNEGALVLKGRPFVEISDYDWRNRKNNTRGNLIDLVAAHKNVTFLQAIAEINGNKRLLLLEKNLGKVKRSYTSFYIPKEQRASSKSASSELSRLLVRHGIQESFSHALLKSGQFQVSKSGLIRIFAQDDAGGALEFTPDGGREWKRTKVGQFINPFHASTRNGRKAVIFTDPFVYLAKKGRDAFTPKSGNDPFIVLMEPDHGVVGRFLASNRGIDGLRIVTTSSGKPSQTEMDFFNNLKRSFSSLGVGIEFISLDKALPGKGRSLEI